jgi:hypothetical protein
VLQVQPILRLVTLLHKRVHVDILVPHDARHPKDYDVFVTHSSSLLSDFDEVVAALYPTQQLKAITAALQTLLDGVTALKLSLQPLIISTSADLATRMAGLTVDASKKPRRDVSKWFTTCFAQIESLSRTILASAQSGGEYNSVVGQ